MAKTPAPAANPDVVIVGGGMVGATLALALKSGGLEPVLIDQAPMDAQLAPTFDGRASAIAFSSFRQWRALGVGAALEPRAQRIEQILVTDGVMPGPGAGPALPAFLRFDAAEIAERTENEPLGYMLENRHIRAALGRGLQDAGVRVLAPAKVADVNFGPGRASVTLADDEALTAPLVIGADGRQSFIRRAAKIGLIGWPYKQSGVVATVTMERPHQGVAHEYFLPGGPFAILPLSGDRASLVWTEKAARAEALMATSPEAFAAHLQRRFGEFVGKVDANGPRFIYALSLGLSERMVAHRCALIGDAAHAIHPIAGQGLNLGLKDIAALAEVLVDAARLGEDIGSELVLERYARWRRFDNMALAAGTDLFTRLFSNDHPPLRLLRGAGMAVVNRISPARRFFMQEAGGATGELPRLLLGERL